MVKDDIAGCLPIDADKHIYANRSGHIEKKILDILSQVAYIGISL